MKRSKTTPKIAILAVLMISIFGIIPTMVQGKPAILGFPGYMAKGPQVSIAPYSWFFPFPPPTFYNPDLAGEASYFVAHMDWHEDWASFWPAPPYEIKLYIDNEEIVLKRFHYYAREPIIPFMAVGSHNWIFTTDFEVGFFEAGEDYEVRVEYWVQKPYLGDESNDWRILNLFGGGLWNFTYTLIIAEAPS